MNWTKSTRWKCWSSIHQLAFFLIQYLFFLPPRKGKSIGLDFHFRLVMRVNRLVHEKIIVDGMIKFSYSYSCIHCVSVIFNLFIFTFWFYLSKKKLGGVEVDRMKIFPLHFISHFWRSALFNTIIIHILLSPLMFPSKWS